MRKNANSALSIQYSVFYTRRVRQRGTALIETAIVLPLYMILLLGLLYFGYATLGRQRQDKATAYAAWQSAPQQAASLVGPGPFWSWNGAMTTNPAAAGASSVTFGDTTFSVYGGSANGQWVRQGDEYYNMTINNTVPIPYQPVSEPYTISGGGSDFFDSERVTAGLDNFAGFTTTSVTTQFFNWVPGQGIQQQIPTNNNTNYTSYAGPYLNNSAPNSSLGLWVAEALSGPPSGGQWLQRRAVESTMNYQPPYLAWITRDNTPLQNSDLNIGNFMGWQNPNPPPTAATMDCDVTIRNPDSVRQGAEEGAQNPVQLLSAVGAMLGANGTLPASNSMDAQILNSSGMTIQDAWTPR
jgi:hypothetical protein